MFRYRTVIPVPLALALIVVPPSTSSLAVRWLGVAVTLGGELLRVAAVREIGTVSRTRTDRLGPLIVSGPFAWVRNPLYLGNAALWIGFALAAQIPWLVAPIALVLALEYHAIVRWEEELLKARRGDDYRRYLANVPRWLPRPPVRPSAARSTQPFPWRDTLYSERGTLIAAGAAFGLLWLKSTLY